MERMLTMLEPGGIWGAKCCINMKRRSDINPDGLLPFNRCDFAKGLYDCDARVVHEQIHRILSNLIDEIGNTGRDSKIMDQANHARAWRFTAITNFRQGHCIASVEKQLTSFDCQFLGNRATNSAARARNKITFHLNLETLNAQRSTSNVEFAVAAVCDHRFHLRFRRSRTTAISPPQGEPIVRRLP